MKIKRIYVALVLLLMMALTVGTGRIMGENFIRPFGGNRTVAHAMGGIDGNEYTNSREAFLYNYHNGHRLFEVDFMTTSDGVVVASHDWNKTYEQMGLEFEGEEAPPLSLTEFKSGKILGRYTPLTLEDILQLMEEYPDIYIVTDTKYPEPEIAKQNFEDIYNAVNAINPDLLHRFAPQVYTEEMYETIMQVYNWENVIFTLYFIEPQYYPDTLEYAVENDIKIMTLPRWVQYSDRFIRYGKMNGVTFFMHTYNNMEEIYTERDRYGVWGFYTDYLTPQQVCDAMTE